MKKKILACHVWGKASAPTSHQCTAFRVSRRCFRPRWTLLMASVRSTGYTGHSLHASNSPLTQQCAAVCKADLVEQLLDRFAGRAPGEILLADRYYQDLILHSPQLETTVMLVATRDLPLANLQRCARFHKSGRTLPLQPALSTARHVVSAPSTVSHLQQDPLCCNTASYPPQRSWMPGRQKHMGKSPPPGLSSGCAGDRVSCLEHLSVLVIQSEHAPLKTA